MSMKSEITEDRDTPEDGSRVLTLRGPLGYQDEELTVSDTLNNGLCITVSDDEGGECVSFHVHSRAEAKLIAERLLAWSTEPVCGPFDDAVAAATPPTRGTP